jgi:monoamine oxidase
MNLYELTKEQLELMERIEGGEDVSELLASAEGAVEAKIERSVFVLKELEALAEAGKREAKRLSERATAKQNSADHLREWIAFNMSLLGMKKQETPIGTVLLNGPRQRLEVDESQCVDWPQEIYEAAVRLEFKVSKEVLKKDFEDRLQNLPGVTVVAGRQTITIR